MSKFSKKYNVSILTHRRRKVVFRSYNLNPKYGLSHPLTPKISLIKRASLPNKKS